MLSIDHNLILASDLEAMRAFLVDVIGVEEGPRPPFPFPGHWLYSGGRPLFHLASANADVAQRDYLSGAQSGGSGPIDHISLTGADFAAVAQRAAAHGYATSLREVPLSGERQLFVQGPDGLKIELLELINPPKGTQKEKKMSENTITNGSPDTVAATLLQKTLVDLVALRFRAKQAHWNVRGTNFRDIHLELDEVVTELDQWIDDSAERIVTLGVAADVRPAEIVSSATVSPIEAGFVNDLEAIAALSGQMTTTITAMRGTVEPLEIEPVSQDLVIGILHGLEKRNWMLRSRAE